MSQISLFLKALIISAGIFFTLTMGSGNASNTNKHEKLELWKLASNIEIAKLFTEICYTDIRNQFKDEIDEEDIDPPTECDEAAQLVNDTRNDLLIVRNNFQLYTIPEIEFAVKISEAASKMCIDGFPMKCQQLKL